MKTQLLRQAVLLGIPVLLVGCVAVQSRLHQGTESGSGLAYYLPKGLLKLTVVQEKVRVESPQGIKTNVTRMRKTTMRESVTNAAGVELGGGRAPIQGTIEYTNSVAEEHELIGIPAGPKENIYETNLYVWASVEIVPDRNSRYLLSLRPSAMADDYMRLEVSGGLLQSVTLTNADQTVGVLTNLLGAAVQIFKTVAAGGVTPFSGDQQTFSTTNVLLIDPFDRTERERLRKHMESRCGLILDFADFEPVYNGGCSALRAEAQGVCYRPLQAYTLKWTTKDQMSAVTLMFPNQAPVLGLEVKRALGVSQSYTLSLQQGMPVAVTLNKASQVAAVAGLPLAVARSLVSLPTEIIQLKLDYSTKHRELLNAKSQEITNLITLLDAEKQLNAALSNRLSSSPPPNVSTPSDQRATGSLPK